MVNVTGKTLDDIPLCVDVVDFRMQSILRASQCRRKETCFVQVASADGKTDSLRGSCVLGNFLVVHRYQVHQVSPHF